MAVTAVLLAATVSCAWLGCLGFARFASAYDRLHCVTFVGVTAGLLLLLAAFAADGFTDRTLKILLFFMLILVNGAAVAHASGRAVMRRGVEAGE
jgi:multicomponent Na+:H+ antiporter subunit G